MQQTSAPLVLPQPHMQVVQGLRRIFSHAGAPAYLVGGYVRNLLLGLPPADLDIASPLLPEALKAAAEACGVADAHIVNPRLGTVLLHICGEKIEHTTFRRESYAPGGGHEPAEVHIGATLLEDAHRRDFAVNALYLDLETLTVEDPTGRGLADIPLRRLRSARPVAEEMIQDDALRLLRLVRFAAQLGFSIENELLHAAQKYAFQIGAISKERIWSELQKILLADTAYPALHGSSTLPPPAADAGELEWLLYDLKDAPHARGVVLLEQLGLLRRLIPEFEGYTEVGPCKYHRYTVFGHTAHTVALTPPDLELRTAALFHDVGKPGVWQETGRMLGHDKRGEAIVQTRLPALGADKKTASHVATLVGAHMYDLNGRTRNAKLRRKIRSLGYPLFEKLIALREADFLGSGTEQPPVVTAEKFRATMAAMQVEGVPMTVAELDISGRDLMERYGLKGREIGEVLNALLDECLLHPAQNRTQNLLRLAGRHIRRK